MADLPDQPTESNQPGLSPIRVHLTDTQLDSIARMLIAGASHYEIAAAFRVSVNRIRRLDQLDADMQDRKARFASDVTRLVVTQKFRMFEKLDKAIDIMEQDGLRAPDARTRLDAAKWWIANTVPPMEQRSQVTVQFPEELVAAIQHLAANDAGLREVQRTKPPLLSRVRTTFEQAPDHNPVPEPTPGDPDGSHPNYVSGTDAA